MWMKELTETSQCYGQYYGHIMQSTTRNIPEKVNRIDNLHLNKKTKISAHVYQATRTTARETSLSI